MASTRDSPKLSALIATRTGIQRSDGRIHRGKLRRPTLILSRALTRYYFLPQPVGLSRNQADRSAMLYAEAHNPYPEGRHVLIRAVRGYSIWWWDFAALREIAKDQFDADSATLVPESSLFEVGEGWRQVKTREGFEAQYWRDLTLIASTWRRRPFSQENWAAFVGEIDHSDTPPDNPPDPVFPKLSRKGVQGLPLVRQQESWPIVQSLTLAVMAALVCVAAWYLGEAVRYSQIASYNQEQFELEFGANNVAVRTPATRPDIQTLALLAKDYARPSPLLVSAALLEIADGVGQVPTRWEVEEGLLKVEFAAADRNSLEQLAASLERHPWIRDVRPQLDPITGAALFLATTCLSLAEVDCESSSSTKRPGSAK